MQLYTYTRIVLLITRNKIQITNQKISKTGRNPKKIKSQLKGGLWPLLQQRAGCLQFSAPMALRGHSTFYWNRRRCWPLVGMGSNIQPLGIQKQDFRSRRVDESPGHQSYRVQQTGLSDDFHWRGASTRFHGASRWKTIFQLGQVECQLKAGQSKVKLSYKAYV